MSRNDFRPKTLKFARNNPTLRSLMADSQKLKLNHSIISISNGGSGGNSDGRKELVVLGIALDSLPKSAQFFVCCGGVFVFYLIYGYVQVSNETICLYNPIFYYAYSFFFNFYLFIYFLMKKTEQ